jgi:hypothetical protein
MIFAPNTLFCGIPSLICLFSSNQPGCSSFVSLHRLALGNFYLTTWEEYHTGVLYLGYFSGPVEGILAIVLLFMITGAAGTTSCALVPCSSAALPCNRC